MTDFKLVSITKSNKSGKKMMAKFVNKKTGRESTTHFGASGYDDYTITKDKEQRTRYRSRHKGDNLTIARSAGALSYYVLWGNSTSKQSNIASYKSRFNL
jgi:hypothetical protein|tara:strand:- start:203 stop:502 length:300 start_codon:yes stop_codon:yes gene_type:complete